MLVEFHDRVRIRDAATQSSPRVPPQRSNTQTLLPSLSMSMPETAPHWRTAGQFRPVILDMIGRRRHHDLPAAGGRPARARSTASAAGESFWAKAGSDSSSELRQSGLDAHGGLSFSRTCGIQRVGETGIDVAGIVHRHRFDGVVFIPGDKADHFAVLYLPQRMPFLKPGLVVSFDSESAT